MVRLSPKTDKISERLRSPLEDTELMLLGPYAGGAWIQQQQFLYYFRLKFVQIAS
jgi:hypothetical protein